MGSTDPAEFRQYETKNEYHSKPQLFYIVSIGAGVSGLFLAYKMKEKFRFENCDLVCYEKNSGVAGAWYENRYPGSSLAGHS